MRLLDLNLDGPAWDFRRAALRRRPEHGLAATQIIVTWAHIESALGNIMASMLKGSPRVAMEMMNALRSFDAQAKAIRGVARLELPEDHSEVLRAILTIVRRPAEIRHTFAHHHWGISPDIEDGLLTADPSMQREWHVELLEYRAGVDRADSQSLERYISVWRLADLAEAQAQMDRAADLAELLSRSLVAIDVPRGPFVLKRLAAEPEVAAAIADQRRRDTRGH